MILTRLQMGTLRNLLKDRAEDDAKFTAKSVVGDSPLLGLHLAAHDLSRIGLWNVARFELEIDAAIIEPAQISALRCAYISAFMRVIGEHFAEVGAAAKEAERGE